MAFGIYRFSLFSFRLPHSYCFIYQKYKISQTVVCGQHVLNSLAKRWPKRVLQETNERQNMPFFIWMQPDVVEISLHNFCRPQACVIILIFVVALFKQYQMILSIFMIIEVLFMFSCIKQTFLENVREKTCVHGTYKWDKNYWCQCWIDVYATYLILTEYFPICFDLTERLIT